MTQIDKTSYNIIVVDDDKTLLKYYKTSLERLLKNCNVEAFTKIDDKFFNSIRDPHIDLFIIDIHLGKQSGIALSNGLLKIMKGLTFLFISGYDYTLESFDEFDGKCIYDYMSKPIDRSELIIRVKALLNISRSYNRVIRNLGNIKADHNGKTVDSLRSRYFEQLQQDQIMIEKIKGEMFRP